jgi:hypothetical protein
MAKFKVGDKVWAWDKPAVIVNPKPGESSHTGYYKIEFDNGQSSYAPERILVSRNSVRSANAKRVRVLKAERLVPDRLVGQIVEVVGGRGDDVFVKDPRFTRLNIPTLLKKGEYEVVNSVLSINSSAGDRGRKALSEGWGHGRLVTWEKEVEEGKRGAEKIRKDIRDLESTLPQVKGTEWFERTKDAIVFIKEFAAKHGIRINSVRSCNSSALEKLIADGDNGKWDSLAWMPKVIGKGSLYPETMKIRDGLGYDQEAKIREAWKSGKYNSVIFYKNGIKKGESTVNACVVRSTNAVVAKAIKAVVAKGLNAMGRDKQDAASVEMWIGVFDNFLSSQAPKFKDKERAKAMGEKIIKDIEKSLGSEGGKVQLQKMGWTVQKMRDALAKALNAVREVRNANFKWNDRELKGIEAVKSKM